MGIKTNAPPTDVVGDFSIDKEKELPVAENSSAEMDDWKKIKQPVKEDLIELMKDMIVNNIKCNVEIKIGDANFHCHMIALQCYSNFFLDCNNEVEIHLPEEKVTPNAFAMIYDWMLAPDPVVEREGIVELLKAAVFLRVNDLVNQCWACLDDDVYFQEGRAFLLYEEAKHFGFLNLQQLMLNRICKFFLTIISSNDFLEYKAKELCTLLSLNSIGVNSEIEIFLSAVRWLNHNWNQRKHSLLSVIKCVRFNIMPAWLLATLGTNIDCAEVDRVVNEGEVKQMITDGISYTTLQHCHHDNHEGFLLLLGRYNLVEPMQRQWIFDKNCSYHHRLDDPNMEYVTYEAFNDYLKSIEKAGLNYWQNVEMEKAIEGMQY